ncbi:XRE family transcriptional regulator [Streptomyces sp. S12]|nr:XRE family transcriptional regulator [Streptomyces sp. S12]
MTVRLGGVEPDRPQARRTHPEAAGPTGYGRALQLARKRSGLTQEQLAAASGVSVRAIRDLELGRASRPRRETTRLLAEALGLTGSHRVLLDQASGHVSVDTTLRQMYEEDAASPPSAMHPLVGRERELDVVAGALLAGRERILSLVGLPGAGKSLLALAVAHRHAAKGGGRVIWLPARAAGGGSAPAAGHGPSLLTSWMLDRLCGDGPLDELAGLIGDRRTLLVVDGYDGPVADGGRLLHLLACCTNLQVLVTMRTPLPVLGVRAVPLAPLPLAGTGAEPGQGAASPAVRLMLAHVAYTRPAMQQTAAVTEAVTGLCRLLDGIPLALHLAAGWLPMYSPEQLLDKARDNPLPLLEPVFAGESEGEADLGALIRGAVGGLRPAQSGVLTALALRRQPSATEEVQRFLGRPPQEVVRALHGLLLRGLIREERLPGGGTAVSVLNLVRHTVLAARERAPRAAVAHV